MAEETQQQQQPNPAASLRPRKELVQAIKEGGSVLIGNQIITKVEDLPSAADLAAASGDAEEQERTAEEIQAEMDRLKSELAKVSRRGSAASEKTDGKGSRKGQATAGGGTETSLPATGDDTPPETPPAP